MQYFYCICNIFTDLYSLLNTLQVSSEDKFSKMACFTCIKRLEGVHRFAMMAYRTQEKLRSQLYGNIDNTNPVQDDEMQNIKDVQDTGKKTEDRGLLHSILTKVRSGDRPFACATFLFAAYNVLSSLPVGCNRNFNRGRATGTTGIKFPRGETLHSEHGGNGSKSGSDAIFTMWHGTVYIRSFRFLG